MRNNLYQNHFHKLYGFILCLSFLSGSFSIGNAQINLRVDQTFADRDESYAQLFRRGRGSDFAQLLTKNVGATDTGNIQSWLDENNASFFRQFDTAFQNEAERHFEKTRKGDKSAKTEIAPKSVGPKSVVPTKRKSSGTRRSAFDSSGNAFFRNASYDPASGNFFNQSAEKSFVEASDADDAVITKTETDDGFQIQGAAEKTKAVGDVTITQSATNDTRLIKVEGGNIGTEEKNVEIVEAVNKKERKSLRTETTMSWRVLLASCPDADGISAGTATATISVKITITNPQTIGILTRDVTTRMTVKGVVNDSAELTHFDLEGATVETVSGYERAERLGLVENVKYTDGTKQLNWKQTNNKLGSRVKDEFGFTKRIEGVKGAPKVTIPSGVSEAEALRIAEFSGFQLGWIYDQVSMYYEPAQTDWRNGGCVEIALSAPKTKLLPSEQTEVAAETVHKYDKSKVSAELILKAATDSATPEKQSGTPQVKFNLTAPKKGETAMIMVESVSRRGIASESLKFGEEKLTKKPIPPKKTPPVKKCGGAWSGKITAVKRKRTESVKPADGRLVRQIENKEETFSIDYHVLGIPDTTQGFKNGYYSDAQMNYRATEYRESNYAAGKMSCDKKIISTTQTQKFESLMTALSRGRITVYVSLGDEGILTFDSPEVNAERIITRTYETSCPSYDRVNSSVDRSDNLIGVPNPGFEIHFELGAKSDTVLVGSKTLQDGDGGETIVTWNLTRDCQ